MFVAWLELGFVSGTEVKGGGRRRNQPLLLYPVSLRSSRGFLCSCYCAGCVQPLPVTALNNPGYQRLYTKFSHFNPIQTQIFHVAYHTDHNLLLGAPTGSGKTVAAELCVMRLMNTCGRAGPGSKGESAFVRLAWLASLVCAGVMVCFPPPRAAEARALVTSCTLPPDVAAVRAMLLRAHVCCVCMRAFACVRSFCRAVQCGQRAPGKRLCTSRL